MGRGKRKRAALPRGKHEKRARRLGNSEKWAEGKEKVPTCPQVRVKREREASEAVQNGQREEKERRPAHEQA